jgi:hypothetical protein
MVGRYEAGQACLAAQGRVSVVRYGYGQAANWRELEDARPNRPVGLSIRALWLGALLKSLTYRHDFTYTVHIQALIKE